MANWYTSHSVVRGDGGSGYVLCFEERYIYIHVCIGEREFVVNALRWTNAPNRGTTAFLTYLLRPEEVRVRDVPRGEGVTVFRMYKGCCRKSSSQGRWCPPT